MGIEVKRVSDPPESDDGKRALGDRVGLRGVRRDAAQVDMGLPEVAPSHALRRWFERSLDRWEAFAQRCFDELESKPEA